MLESPLTELGLIKAIGKSNGFRFVRGPKLTLGDGVLYTLCSIFGPAIPRTLLPCPLKRSPTSPAGRAESFFWMRTT